MAPSAVLPRHSLPPSQRSRLLSHTRHSTCQRRCHQHNPPCASCVYLLSAAIPAPPFQQLPRSFLSIHPAIMHPIYLWYPNLVGYGRIISTIIAFSIVFDHPLPASVFYATGQLFDAVDGIVARHFHQTSKFGALLDMLTDRLSTATLLIVLSHLYPHHWGLYAALITLDIVSHWCQMYSKLAQNIKTHKGSQNPLLNFYYTFPYALLVFCVGNEACFIALYLLSFDGWGKGVHLFFGECVVGECAHLCGEAVYECGAAV